MTHPLVSVVVPNYNHGRYLERRLDSIFAQTFKDFEVILLDDASTDDSRELIARYAMRENVRVCCNTSNSGTPFAQWNRGVKLARGEHVWIAESDDYADPELLERLIPALNSDRETVLSYCESWRVDEASQVLGTMNEVWDATLDPDRWTKPFVNDGCDECSKYLIWKNTIPNASAVVFRRSAYERSGGADEHMKLCGDWFTWARLLRLGRIAYTPERLNYFRQHPGSVRAATAWSNHLREQWLTRGSILRSHKVSPDVRRRLVGETVNQLFDQVLPAAKGSRARLLLQALSSSGVILRGSPCAAALAIVRRVSRGVNRRLSRKTAS